MPSRRATSSTSRHDPPANQVERGVLVRRLLGASSSRLVLVSAPAGYGVIRGALDIFYNGLHLAGPNLTPKTFETGMFSYPVGQGPAGRWDFSPNHYTGASDARVVWWDPDQPSQFNGELGAYRDDGTRVRQGQFPEEEIEVFK